MDDFPKQFSDYINATIKPYIADKGYDWRSPSLIPSASSGGSMELRRLLGGVRRRGLGLEMVALRNGRRNKERYDLDVGASDTIS